MVTKTIFTTALVAAITSEASASQYSFEELCTMSPYGRASYWIPNHETQECCEPRDYGKCLTYEQLCFERKNHDESSWVYTWDSFT